MTTKRLQKRPQQRPGGAQGHPRDAQEAPDIANDARKVPRVPEWFPQRFLEGWTLKNVKLSHILEWPNDRFADMPFLL